MFTTAIESLAPIQQSGNDIRIGHISGSELLHNVSISYDLIVPAETRLRSHRGSGSQNLAAASSAGVFLMLIFNLVLLLHSRKHRGPARARPVALRGRTDIPP